MNFINKYFIEPMFNKTGYNAINTTIYATIALICVYLIYIFWKKRKWIDNQLIYSLIPFVLFGSTKRVITDAVDGGLLKGGIYNLYKYNIFNISPFIYISIGILFILIYSIERHLKKKNLTIYLGSLLFIFHFLLLIPALHVVWDVILPVSILTLIPVGVVYIIFDKNVIDTFTVFAQTLDGAATYFAVNFLGYGEQHVLPNFIGNTYGYEYFYFLKIIISSLFVYLIKREEEVDKKIIAYAIVITIGLAPGVRDILRMMTGV